MKLRVDSYGEENKIEQDTYSTTVNKAYKMNADHPLIHNKSSSGSIYDQGNSKKHRPLCNSERINAVFGCISQQPPIQVDSKGRPTNYEEGAIYHQLKKSGCCNKIQRVHSASDILSIVRQTKNEEVESCNEVDKGTSKAMMKGPPAIPDDNILVSPDQYLNLLLKASGKNLKQVPALSLPKNFFMQPSEKDISGFTLSVVSAIQNSDISALRTLQKDHGQTFQGCCNRFGESVTHMACRRGLVNVVSFLLSDGNVNSIRICDDYGRTPIHDAIWCREPNFEIMDMLIAKDPMLLLVTDRRGFTPFQYAKREDWNLWLHFLRSRYDVLTANVDDDLLALFSC